MEELLMEKSEAAITGRNPQMMPIQAAWANLNPNRPIIWESCRRIVQATGFA